MTSLKPAGNPSKSSLGQEYTSSFSYISSSSSSLPCLFFSLHLFRAYHAKSAFVSTHVHFLKSARCTRARLRFLERRTEPLLLRVDTRAACGGGGGGELCGCRHGVFLICKLKRKSETKRLRTAESAQQFSAARLSRRSRRRRRRRRSVFFG